MNKRGWITIAIMLALFLLIGFHLFSILFIVALNVGEKGIKRFEAFISK